MTDAPDLRALPLVRWLRATSWRARVGALLVLLAAAALLLAALPPIQQPADYYSFADDRTLLGVPRGLDTLSNLPFAIVGLLGLATALRAPRGFRVLTATLFAGVLATAFGSTWFHLAPSPDRLLWDRLPITVAFMATLALVLTDRVHPRTGRVALVPLITAGVLATLAWYFGPTGAGSGDLRRYILVQAYPLLAIPLCLILFAPARLDGHALLAALGLYALAKLTEFLDARIFELGHVVSGHTLKHLLAGGATWCILVAVRRAGTSPPDATAAETSLRTT